MFLPNTRNGAILMLSAPQIQKKKKNTGHLTCFVENTEVLIYSAWALFAPFKRCQVRFLKGTKGRRLKM